MFSQVDWHLLFEDHGFPLAIMGLLVVFAALLLVCTFISLLPRIMAILDHLHPEEKESPQTAIAPVEGTSSELPSEVIAIIAATVAATVGKPHRIVHTRQLTSEDARWSMEGRQQHHASHQVRPPRQ